MHRVALPLALLLLVCWGVSFYGLDFGVHWDENRAKLDSVRNSLKSGLFLQSVDEPAGYSYNYGGVNYLLTWSGLAPELATFLIHGPGTREALSEAITPILYGRTIRLRLRAIYAFLSSLSVLWLYFLCRAMDRSRTEAFFAAAILGLSWEVTYHSRWIAPDAVMMQFAVLAFLCLAVGMKRKSVVWLYASAIAVGLTAGTKYPGALILLFLLIGAAYVLWQERPSVAHVAKHVLGLAAATALTFVLTTPGVLLDPFRFFAQVQEQRDIYASGWYGYTLQSGLHHFLEILKYFVLQGLSFYWSISILFTVLFVLGLLALVKTPRLITLLMAGFCLSYLAFFSVQRAMLVRNLVVILPFLALVAARGITALSGRLGNTGTRALYGVIGIALAMNLGWQVYAAGQIRHRTDLDYFLRKFEDYAQGSTGDVFFVSAELLAALNRLPDRLPDNIATPPDSSYTKVAFLQSEGPDVFWEKWPANRWNTYERIFGGMEVNLEAYPTFVGNERVLVVNRERMDRLPVTADYLAAPKFWVSKTEVVAGKDSYILRIKNVSNANVILRFLFDAVAEPEFALKLDDKGEAKIDVAANVRKGSYRFLAYRREDETTWHNIDVTVVVK
jgi:4-amino-4-deoxy-L-arabinose transferase-like glycosyltransferase